MAQSSWEADKMLDVYIYDYLLKRNLQASAKAFMVEGKVASDPVAIDAPGGFLFEWWSVFWDIFIARTNEKHSEVAAAYIEAQQMKAREQQQMQMQQFQIMQQRHAQMQRRDANHASLNGPLNGMNSEGVLGQSPASVLAAKVYEERLKHPHSMDSESSPQLLDANRMALLKSATNHSGQLLQGTPGNVSAALQQIHARSQQTADIKSEVNLAASQRSLPMDSSMYGQGVMQSKSGLGSPGINQGVSGLPLKGWPLTQGIDQLRSGLGQQVHKSFLQTPNQLQQFQLLSPQQQHHLLAQAQAHAAQGGLGSSGTPNYGEMDPRRFRVLQRGGLNGKDGQPTGTDGTMGSIQASSPMARAGSQDQAELLMKMKMTQIQQLSAHQQPTDQLQQQQLQQNNRKRKQQSPSGAANSTGTGNTTGPSPNSAPSTPSTHTPGDGMTMPGSLTHVNSMPKSLMMYGPDGTGGLTSSSNQLEDMEHFGDVGSLEDNVESFLSHDDGDTRDALFGSLKRSPMEHNTDSSKGFSFSEVDCLSSNNSKVICCHFSSDGKLLASAGHEMKVVLWNMDTLKTESTPEEHTSLITDIRFKPNSTQLATSSFDRTIRLWNATDPSYCLPPLTGHKSHVMSLDFHPKKTDLLCSCDGNSEIRYWNVAQLSCTRLSKGGTAQVRFQPRVGQLLAAAAENVVSIFDVETDRRTHTLKRHTKPVHSVCWDASGDYLASVSEDSVRVWSLASGEECIHELNSNGNNFHSCVFHPSFPTLLVIGGYQTLELWNMAEDSRMSIQAHEGLIAALAQSPATGMVASASHDKCVKIWK
ncbi:transcriptional corepressor LEUNIG_HOMOLOG isoform X1 [Amborella trichopoda]|nr:transcriptional corepressor LEUNIG_HOMOLOG isoform X1 [Amborella trichopoda]XP_020530985.1 transcriptional corepressor LEUNIG_HOMOLOG isoform X1 [Amborella trichopoda]|eukprot:XP_020530984.1 transcriptional corepressor LEUNIG_HOMOLOG isoform X1 [Amborella trichopoda]